MSSEKPGEGAYDLLPSTPTGGPSERRTVTAAGSHVGSCVHCGFDCTGVKSAVCPECGRSLLMPQVAEGEEVEIAPAVYVWCCGVLLLALILLGVTLSTDRWRMLNVGEVVAYLLAMVLVSVVWLWIACRTFVDCDTQWPLTALQVAMSEAIVLVLCVFVGSRMGLEFHPLWPWNVVISVVAGFLLYNLVLKLDTTDAALVVLFQRAIGIGVFYGVVRVVS